MSSPAKDSFKQYLVVCISVIGLCAVLAFSLAAIASAALPGDSCSMTVQHATKGAPVFTKDYPGRWAASGWVLRGTGVVESRRGNVPWRTRAAAAQHLASMRKHDGC